MQTFLGRPICQCLLSISYNFASKGLLLLCLDLFLGSPGVCAGFLVGGDISWGAGYGPGSLKVVTQLLVAD